VIVATDVVDELLGQINDHINNLGAKERIMVLCTLGEHCKAYAQTILAHEYHAALYGRRKEDGRLTIWEKLFGTPERTASTLEYVDQIDVCDFMERASGGKHPTERCEGCLYDYDRYGCEDVGKSVVEWLSQEVGK
jgi:hypothetical protein